MKLGSLFDGSGGFPLAGVLNGITPVWASEIEPYPIAVTSARLPSMKHLGSITEINGGNIEPVDIVTFGSPCQDLSIAGNQKGIENGARSSLFFQAIRIIKEMRDATNGVYPNYAVWENVPGAFSSNKGNDFRLVLEALANVSGSEVSIPLPEKGKWQRAGEIVGDGWSIAWRILDAQFWGVPQRRKRIYLVADFGSERAGDILFKPDSVLGYPAQSSGAGEGTADDAERSVGGSYSFEPGAARRLNTEGRICKDLCPTLRAHMGDNQPAVCYSPIEGCGAFCAGASPLARSIGYDELVSPTLKSANAGLSMHAVVYPQVARTLEARHDSSPCIDRGQNIICLHDKATRYQGGGETRDNDGGGNGLGVSEDGVQYTLTSGDRHAVCMPQAGSEDLLVYPINLQVITRHKALGRGTGFGAGKAGDAAYTLQAGHEHGVVYAVDCRNMCLNEELSSTLQAKENGGQSLNYQNPVVYPAVTGTLCASGAGTQRPAGQANEGELCVVFPRQRSDELVENNVASCQSARQYKDATDLVVANARPPRKYIVRRLTPTECARLQGFPDAWGELAPYDGDDAFWQGVYKTACEIKGGKYTPKKDLRKWYNGLHADSAEYKMWGNGIALPCAEYVIRSIKRRAQ